MTRIPVEILKRENRYYPSTLSDSKLESSQFDKRFFLIIPDDNNILFPLNVKFLVLVIQSEDFGYLTNIEVEESRTET